MSMTDSPGKRPSARDSSPPATLPVTRRTSRLGHSHDKDPVGVDLVDQCVSKAPQDGKAVFVVITPGMTRD